MAKEVKPDIVLMDLNMPECSGLEALRMLKETIPAIKVIILTVSDDDSDVFTAIKDGAEGYLCKDMEPYQLFEMLKRASKGEPAVGRKLAARILQEFKKSSSLDEVPLKPDKTLTPREIEVLELVGKGETNAEIAHTLYISENTVKLHLRSILEKLHLKNRIQAAVYAVRHGLISEQH
jgi:DNA-binding NarL/FixJ family response regulator